MELVRSKSLRQTSDAKEGHEADLCGRAIECLRLGGKLTVRFVLKRKGNGRSNCQTYCQNSPSKFKATMSVSETHSTMASFRPFVHPPPAERNLDRRKLRCADGSYLASSGPDTRWWTRTSCKIHGSLRAKMSTWLVSLP